MLALSEDRHSWIWRKGCDLCLLLQCSLTQLPLDTVHTSSSQLYVGSSAKLVGLWPFQVNPYYCRSCHIVYSNVTPAEMRLCIMEGIVISPALKKPKKQSVEAAQSIVTSASPALTDHRECILLKIAGVIGSLIRLIRGSFGSILF